MQTFLRYLRICEIRVDKARNQGYFSNPLDNAFTFYRLYFNNVPEHVTEALTRSNQKMFAETASTARHSRIAKASDRLIIETTECAAPEIGLQDRLMSIVKVINDKTV